MRTQQNSERCELDDCLFTMLRAVLGFTSTHNKNSAALPVLYRAISAQSANVASNEMYDEMLTIKHLRLSTEPVTLLNQAINLFASFQNAFNGLV